MMLMSIVRGAFIAALVASTLAVYRAIDFEGQAWLIPMVGAHLVLPIAAAFWGRRPDASTLDVGLVGIGLSYIVLLALVPSDWSTASYIVLPIIYCGYSLLAAGAFAALAQVRTAMRVRGFARLRRRASTPPPAIQST